MRRDDGVGLVVAREILGLSIPSVTVLEWPGDASGLIDRFQDAAVVYLVDAMQSGHSAGTVVRFNACAGPLPESYFPPSTHRFGVSRAIELARTVYQLPERLIVYGIEGYDFSPGVGLSQDVMLAAERVVAQIANELRDVTHSTD